MTVQCLLTAFVLWAHGSTGWAPIRTFEALRDCEAYREQLIQTELHGMAPRSRMCLPDTVDPRATGGR